MSKFIQSLESRTLLSGTPVTQATLAADDALIVANAATAKGDLKTLSAAAKADMKTIQTDLKGLPKTNAPLLKKLKADESKLLVQITKDLNALLNPGKALGKRATVDGESLLKKATARLQAKVGAEGTTLGLVTLATLAKLQADSQGTAIVADLQALAAANPGSAVIAADTTKTMTDLSTQNMALVTAATTFQTGTGTLATDLGSAASASSIFPTVTGTYSGTATETAGKHVGRVAAMSFDFTGESPAGALTGTVTLTEPGNSPVTLTLAGTVTATGAFSATLTDPSGQGNDATLAGKVLGTTITGTYQATGGGSSRGTFSVHQ
jgi:hypothetical protein